MIFHKTVFTYVLKKYYGIIMGAHFVMVTMNLMVVKYIPRFGMLYGFNWMLVAKVTHACEFL